MLSGKHFLSFHDRALALKTKGKIFLHFLNAHPAFFQADQVFDPFYIMFIENTAVVAVTFYVGN